MARRPRVGAPRSVIAQAKIGAIAFAEVRDIAAPALAGGSADPSKDAVQEPGEMQEQGAYRAARGMDGLVGHDVVSAGFDLRSVRRRRHGGRKAP